MLGGGAGLAPLAVGLVEGGEHVAPVAGRQLEPQVPPVQVERLAALGHEPLVEDRLLGDRSGGEAPDDLAHLSLPLWREFSARVRGARSRPGGVRGRAGTTGCQSRGRHGCPVVGRTGSSLSDLNRTPALTTTRACARPLRRASASSFPASTTPGSCPRPWRARSPRRTSSRS